MDTSTSIWMGACLGTLFYSVGFYEVLRRWVLNEDMNPDGWEAWWVPSVFWTRWWLHPLWPLALVLPAILWPLLALYVVLVMPLGHGLVWLVRCCGIFRCAGAGRGSRRHRPRTGQQDEEAVITGVEPILVGGSINPSADGSKHSPPDSPGNPATTDTATESAREKAHLDMGFPPRRPEPARCHVRCGRGDSLPRIGGWVVIRQVGGTSFKREDRVEPPLARVRDLPHGTHYS